jgi:hypothetical protein
MALEISLGHSQDSMSAERSAGWMGGARSRSTGYRTEGTAGDATEVCCVNVEGSGGEADGICLGAGSHGKMSQ